MLTVLCPDVPLDEADHHRWPARLAARLSRARLLDETRDDAPVPAATPLEAWLSRRFGLEDPAGAAAWQRHAWPMQTSGQAARATGVTPDARQSPPDAMADPCLFTVVPASLHAGMDHLVLQGPQDLAVSPEEALALTAAANSHLEQDATELHVVVPACWVMKVSAPLRVTLHSSLNAHGRSIEAFMPAGPDARQLRRLLNEIQMLWHAHPVNEARQANGLQPINTVWVEGIALPGRHPQPFTDVYADAPTIRGLALGHGLAASRVWSTHEFTGRDTRTARQKRVLLELSGENGLERLDALLADQGGDTDVVLTDARRTVTLHCAQGDSLRFWRRTRFRQAREP